MSLVGTRPPTVDEWEKYELHHRSRMSTKPGITGMWQVSGRSDITDFEEVVRLDTEYIARKIIEDEKIDIVHHITFNEFRTPGKLYQLPVPFVWGPIGGGQFYNPIFKDAYFSRKDINKEKLRNFINRFYLIFSSDIKAAVKKANTILIADQSTESIMPKSRKYVRLLETGYVGGIAINSDTVIGKNVEILQGVTIGYERRGKRQGNPTIGNNVWIGSNAVIVGKILMGDANYFSRMFRKVEGSSPREYRKKWSEIRKRS